MLTDNIPMDDKDKAMSIPSIYLNSSDRQDGICLHTPQDGDKIVQFAESIAADDKTPTNDCYGRRASQRSWSSEPGSGQPQPEFNWLDTFDPSRSVKRRFQKRRSSSSSSGYTQSASHISTCGSKSRFGSIGCRSLPEVSSEVDLRLLATQDYLSAFSTRRQVKSCTNLAIFRERRTADDEKSDSGTEGETKKTFEEMLDKSYASVPETLESQSQKEERIQHWLRNLYLPPEEET